MRFNPDLSKSVRIYSNKKIILENTINVLSGNGQIFKTVFMQKNIPKKRSLFMNLKD